MSLVYIGLCLLAAYGIADLIEKCREESRRIDTISYCRTGEHPWQPDDPDWDDDTCPWHADVLRAYDEELSP